MSLFKQASPEVDRIKYTATVSGAAYAVFAYAFFWIAFTVWTGLNHKNPMLFTVHSIVIAIEAIGVYLIVQYAKKSQIKSIRYQQWYLNVAILLGALHWGILTTYMINFCEISSAQEIAIRLVVTGFATVASMLFCMINPVGYLCVLFIGLPHVITEYFQDDGYSGFILFLVIALLAFTMKANQIIQRSYQSLIQSLGEANQHADLMEKVSMYDYQTGVYSRFHLIQEYELLWKQSAISGTPLSLISIEIDQIKALKSAHGNHFADQCKKAVADILKEKVAPSDALGQYDGNVFMMIMPDASEAKVVAFAKDVLAEVKGLTLKDNEGKAPIELTCAIGLVCVGSAQELGPEELIDFCLRALSDAQQKGHHQYHLSTEH